MSRRFWEFSQKVQGRGQVANSLGICRLLGCLLSRLLPRCHRFLDFTTFRIVMGNNFGLGFRNLWKLPFKNLSDLLMVVLTDTAQ